MSVKQSKVLVEDVANEGLSDEELSLMFDVCRRTVLKVKAILATEAKFSLSQFASTKKTSLAGCTVLIEQLNCDGAELWQCTLAGPQQKALITYTIETA